MSAPIRIELNRESQPWVRQFVVTCSLHRHEPLLRDIPNAWLIVAAPDTIGAAADAGREHLAKWHAPAPIVQTVVSSMRCTCGDLPASSWPYFQPCPVHTWTVNTSNTPMTYSRVCGIGLDDCQARHCDCAELNPAPLATTPHERQDQPGHLRSHRCSGDDEFARFETNRGKTNADTQAR